MSVTSPPRRLSARCCLALVLLPACAALPARERKGVPNAARPEERTDETAVSRHRHLREVARKGAVQVLFLGDSITRRWEESGRAVWQEHFAPLGAGNFGVGGDSTQHVLWRITAGKELEGLHPRACVLLIGTNNLTTNSAAEVAEGIQAIVRELRRRQPDMHLLLLGLFPRGARASDPLRGKIKEVNRKIARLHGLRVHYLDIGDRFLGPDGSLSKDVMPDYLHPGKKGFQIWADAVLPRLQAVLRKPGRARTGAGYRPHGGDHAPARDLVPPEGDNVLGTVTDNRPTSTPTPLAPDPEDSGLEASSPGDTPGTPNGHPQKAPRPGPAGHPPISPR